MTLNQINNMTAFPPVPPRLFDFRLGLEPTHNGSPNPLEKPHKREIVNERALRGVQGAIIIHLGESAAALRIKGYCGETDSLCSILNKL